MRELGASPQTREAAPHRLDRGSRRGWRLVWTTGRLAPRHRERLAQPSGGLQATLNSDPPVMSEYVYAPTNPSIIW